MMRIWKRSCDIMIKAVLFDMDGTIIDSEPLHAKIVQDIIKKEFNIKVTKEEILKYAGIAYKEKLKRILNKRMIEPNLLKLAEIAHQKSLEFSHLLKRIDGSEKTVKKIKENFKIGLVTGSSKKQAKIFLESTDLKKYFKLIITNTDVEKNKPYPDSYLLAIKKLRLVPKECVAIEDSTTGIKAAKSAGMFCIAVKNKYNKNQDFSMADIEVDDIRKITINLIKNLN